MGQQRTHDSTAPLGVKAVCALIAVSAAIAFFYGLHFVVQGGDHDTLLGTVLVVLALFEGVAARGLWHLKPWSWYAGMVIAVLAAVVAFYVLILKIDDPLFPGIHFLGNVVAAAYIYHQRPIYTPNTQARYEAIRSDSVLGEFEFYERMKADQSAPLGMRLLVVVGALFSVVAFFQGIYYIWHHGHVVTGLVLVVAAAVELYVLYGLWFVQRWAWFAGIALFGLGGFLALLRVLLVGDTVAIAEFVVDAVVVAYLLSKKPVYAPRVRIDLTPR
jgi:uncharacterized membrane protein (DUF2068 family)